MVTNPWGIAGLVLALFLIHCLISMVSERKKKPTPDPEPATELPPDNSSYLSVFPRETEWFDAEVYAPYHVGLYKTRRYFWLKSESGFTSARYTELIMLVWDGFCWIYPDGDRADDSGLQFRGLLEKES